MSTDAYFHRTGEGELTPTAHTGGAWAPDEQHVAPAIGVCVHELLRRSPSELRLARLSVDILGLLRLEPMQVEVAVLRPGRTIELAEVVVSQHGRAALRARAWRLAPHESASVAGGAGTPLPADLPAWDMSATWDSAFIETLDVRRASPGPGRAQAWLATDLPLVADEEVTDLAWWCGLLDTANGIAVRRPPAAWAFPNLDLTLHLHRQPLGRRLGLDTTVVFGADGLGVTSSTVHDDTGPVGRLEQVLTVRRR